MKKIEQQFLKELESKLWNAADKLRSTLGASQYKRLNFVKYVSDAFKIRQDEIKAALTNLENEYYLAPANFSAEEFAGEIELAKNGGGK